MNKAVHLFSFVFFVVLFEATYTKDMVCVRFVCCYMNPKAKKVGKLPGHKLKYRLNIRPLFPAMISIIYPMILVLSHISYFPLLFFRNLLDLLRVRRSTLQLTYDLSGAVNFPLLRCKSSLTV